MVRDIPTTHKHINGPCILNDVNLDLLKVSPVDFENMKPALRVPGCHKSLVLPGMMQDPNFACCTCSWANGRSFMTEFKL
jgi:hypothetical protein